MSTPVIPPGSIPPPSTPPRSARPQGRGPGISTKAKSQRRLGRIEPDSDEASKHKSALVEQQDYLRRTLEPRFQTMVRYWGLYANHKREFRGRNEKWRANINLPWPFLMTETVTAVVSDLFNSGDPLVQATNVHDNMPDSQVARNMERTLSWALMENKWRIITDDLHRACSIQGVAAAKVIHQRRTQEIRVHSDVESTRAFLEAVREVEEVVGVPAPPLSDLAAFEHWRQMVNRVSRGIKVPPVPVPGVREIVQYDGPVIQPTPVFELRFDPWLQNVQAQPHFFQRYVKPISWLESMVKRGTFSKKVLDSALTTGEGTDSRRFDQWETEVASMMGLEASTDDPRMRNSVEVFECFTPFSKIKHGFLFNREIFDSPSPFEMPFFHGQIPFFMLRNITMPRPGAPMLGMSEYQQTEDVFREANTLRSLRMDAVILAVLPILLKKATSGDIPEAVSQLKPGQIISVNALDQISQLVKNDPGILAGFREMPELKNEIEEVFGATPNVRGAAATVGRVSATESERRVAQALIRQKTRLVRYEEDYQDCIQQMLMVFYQFSKPKLQTRVAGGQMLAEVEREDLLGALNTGFRFRGASRVVDKAIVAQQSMQFVSTFGQYMLPQEVRKVMRSVWELFGLPGADDVVSPEGDGLIQIPVPQGLSSVNGQAAQGALPGVQPGVQPPGVATPAQAQAQGTILGPDGNPIQ